MGNLVRITEKLNSSEPGRINPVVINGKVISRFVVRQVKISEPTDNSNR